MFIGDLPRSVLLTINVLDKGCNENQNTHFIFNNFFENVPLWDDVWKYYFAREVTDNNVILGQVINKASNICAYILNNRPSESQFL